ncbi:folate family ECF transporter S component [Oscillospiraceae bacterium OttesenSCG-928-G22]|nr:folate family ECF transporter S component [Oscillospiraceae bacterium OttesenSCG-928-G22]
MERKRNGLVLSFVVAGLLLAADIVFSRFLSFYTPGFSDRIGLQFVPNGLSGLLLGPVWGFITCAAADVLGMMVFPSGGGGFMPLITLAAGLRGLLYGLVLYRKPLKLARTIVSVAVVTVLVELLVMPLVLSILFDNAFPVLFLAKLPVRLVTIPVYGLVLHTVAKATERAGFLQALSGPKARSADTE